MIAQKILGAIFLLLIASSLTKGEERKRFAAVNFVEIIQNLNASNLFREANKDFFDSFLNDVVYSVELENFDLVSTIQTAIYQMLSANGQFNLNRNKLSAAAPTPPMPFNLPNVTMQCGFQLLQYYQALTERKDWAFRRIFSISFSFYFLHM